MDVGEPPTPEQEPDLAEAAEPEAESEDDAAVEEPPAAEMEAEEADAAGDETAPSAEPEGVADPETGAESEAAETADPEPDAPEAVEGEEPPAEIASGGGGDTGGAPIEEPPEPEAPELANADPVWAMGAAAKLPPAQSLRALSGVSAAVGRSVGDRQAALAANPPTLERPSGAPSAAEMAAEAAEAPPPAAGAAAVERAPEGAPPPPVVVAPLPAPAAPPTAGVRTPLVSGGAQGELGDDGARAIQASIRSLPVHDPGLDVSAGPPPRLELAGTADPARVADQRDRLDTAVGCARVQGARELLQPVAGESDIRPRFEPETLRATLTDVPAPVVAPVPAATPAVGGDGAADASRGLSAIAVEERGGEIAAAGAQATAGMTTARTEHDSRVADEHARSQEAVAEAVRANAAEQRLERGQARVDALAQRRQWSGEQRDVVKRSRAEADRAGNDASEEVRRQQTTAHEQAAAHLEQGDRDAAAARLKGEEKAERERERGERESKSGGFFGWLAKKAADFFDGVKAAIQRAFEAARAAVRAVIEAAKNLATAVIERAREAIVAAIKAAGDLLVAIGDRVLAAFPALRDRFRKAVQERVARAEAAVNRLADTLKEGVQKALDLLGGALEAALGLLEKGLLAYVDLYGSVVQGAIRFAKNAVQALAAFAVLIDDVAPGPLRWVTNLGASVKEGIRNHLWKPFETAIKRWFNEKLEEVLGLGPTVWNLIRKGGISIARIGTMVWEGLKAIIPVTLIELLIEKLVAMVVPAVGAILTIIEGLRAAWGTVQRILEAFERFFAFLKAVKTGRAGPQFATAVAAAAIAVIDFVANWLLMRLRKPAEKLAKRIKALAKKIGGKLGRVAKKVGKAFFKKGRKPKVRKTPTRKPKPDKRAKAERRVNAAADFLGRQLARGMPFLVLRAQMLFARGRYRVRLRLRDRNETATLIVEANPRRPLPLRKDYKDTIDVDDYRARAEQLLGWIARHHDLHHILPKEHNLSRWWDGLGIDYNAPTLMLELPPFLHQSGVHRDWRLLRSTVQQENEKAVRQLKYGWNPAWDIWVVAKMAEHKIMSPAQLAASSPQFRAARRNDVNRRIDWMLGVYSAKTRYDLRRFRVSGERGAPYREKYRKKIASFINGMKKHRHPMQIRAWISSWLKGRNLTVRLTRKQARALLKYWRSQG